jgi:hypothetical protein
MSLAENRGLFSTEKAGHLLDAVNGIRKISALGASETQTRQWAPLVYNQLFAL